MYPPSSVMHRKSRVLLIRSQEDRYTVKVDAFIVDETYAADIETYIMHHMDL